MLNNTIPESYQFSKRVKLGADDPINSALNYGYGVLSSFWTSCLYRVGLDPECGFLHSDQPGRLSLTCDLIEPYRALIVDRTLSRLYLKSAEIEVDECEV